MQVSSGQELKLLFIIMLIIMSHKRIYIQASNLTRLRDQQVDKLLAKIDRLNQNSIFLQTDSSLALFIWTPSKSNLDSAIIHHKSKTEKSK